jgi:hypothetical protein
MFEWDELIILCFPIFYIIWKTRTTSHNSPTLTKNQNNEILFKTNQYKLKKIQENIQIAQNSIIKSLLILYQ